jgi:hypothetical protein
MEQKIYLLKKMITFNYLVKDLLELGKFGITEHIKKRLLKIDRNKSVAVKIVNGKVISFVEVEK